MIDRSHELPLTRQAKVLKLSHSGLYYRPRPGRRPIWRSAVREPRAKARVNSHEIGRALRARPPQQPPSSPIENSPTTRGWLAFGSVELKPDNARRGRLQTVPAAGLRHELCE